MLTVNQESSLAQEGQFLILPLIISVLVSLAFILLLVWMNTERIQLSYKLRKEQQILERVEEEYATLSVEREKLFSPQGLGKQAEQMGLVPAKPGQVRRMNLNEEK